MTWIKITPETLPPVALPILLATDDGIVLAGCLDFDKVWWLDAYQENWSFNRIIYWMPLPEPPKDE